MEKKFCPYCGRPLDGGCDCEAQAEYEDKQFQDEYYDSHEYWDGCAFEDKLAMQRYERDEI